MFPQLFVNVFSRESPKIVTVWMVASFMEVMLLKFTQKGRTLGLTFCRRTYGSSGTQEEGDSVTAWESDGLLEDENSMHYCSGEARIAGRHRWFTSEMIV